MYPTCLYPLWCPSQGLTPGRCSPSESGLEDFFSDFLFCTSEKIRFQGHRILLPTDTLNWPSWPWHPVSGIPAQWGLAPTSLCYSVLPDATHCPLVRESISPSPPLAISPTVWGGLGHCQEVKCPWEATVDGQLSDTSWCMSKGVGMSVLLRALQNIQAEAPYCVAVWEHKMVLNDTKGFLYGRTVTKLTWRWGSG